MNLQSLETPCFLLDEGEFSRSVTGFRQALDKHFSRNIIGYSVKTNSLPYCLKLARQLGCYAEVVSSDEFDLALKCGFTINHIIYNGPMKSKSTFLQAIEGGAHVNIETFREIDWLSELTNDKQYGVGIRLNIDISQISPADQNHPDDNSRFGFSAESDDFGTAISEIKKLGNIKIEGLHTHRTSMTRSPEFYRHVVEYAQPIIEKYQLKLDYWDLGGGYFGMMPGKPAYRDYSDVISDTLSKENNKLCIVVEPGNALVASAFDYFAQVIDVKHHNGAAYVTTDATRNDIDPFFHKSDYFKELLVESDRKSSAVPQIVSGSTCLEYDRLFTLQAGKPELKVGDKILFHRVGAYTMCLTPLFISYFPKVYAKEANGNVKVVRDRWKADDFLSKSII